MSKTVIDEEQLALRFEGLAAPKGPDLESQVLRIIQQRGAFRHITEKSLQDEINYPESIQLEDAKVNDDDDDESEEESAQARQERVWKAREEMLQKLSYAQNEILSALDFVSFLLSKQVPSAASSMSPVLQQAVPKATLGAKVIQAPRAMSKATRRRLFKISDGWKLDAFRKGAEKLADASRRLQQESRRQARYWEQISELKGHGWPVSRLPSNSRAIGVHFGFPEAAPQFRNRGFGLLLQNEDGDIELDTRSHRYTRKPLRYSILRDGVETGSYTVRTDSEVSKTRIHQTVTRARDTLFDEELFFELSLEARTIANQRVRTQPQLLEAQISPGVSLQIGVDERLDSDNLERVDDTLARFIAVCSRLLLMAEHQRNYDQRSHSPPPMSILQSTRPEYAILRPVLAWLRHKPLVEHVKQYLQGYSSLLKHCTDENYAIRVSSESSNTDNLSHLSFLRGVVTSTVYLNEPKSDSQLFMVEVETYLGSPIYGSAFKMQSNNRQIVALNDITIKQIGEAEARINYMIMLLVVGKVKVLSEPDTVQVKWAISKARSGEFLLSRGSANVARALFRITHSEIRLVVRPLDKNKATVCFVWKGSQFFQEIDSKIEICDRKTLTEIVTQTMEFIPNAAK